MIPAQYATPAAVIIAASGFVACFAGYRLFRLVLAVYGFILGAAVASYMIGGADASAWKLLILALSGGVLGALLMVFAFFTGVGLVGAGLAALALNLGWRVVGGEPPTLILVIACVLGALFALSVSRWVVIIGTAVGGAWTLVLGVLALMGNSTALAAALDGDVLVLYPLDPARGGWVPTLAFLVLTALGIVVQMSTTSTMGKRKVMAKKRAA
jgi:hypothetical protein